VLGVFVPSGGSKWVIEAPYVLQAANLHQVHRGWAMQIYNAEALPNLINRFWMLPLWASCAFRRVTWWATECCSSQYTSPSGFSCGWFFERTLPYLSPVKQRNGGSKFHSTK